MCQPCKGAFVCRSRRQCNAGEAQGTGSAVVVLLSWWNLKSGKPDFFLILITTFWRAAKSAHRPGLCTGLLAERSGNTCSREPAMAKAEPLVVPQMEKMAVSRRSHAGRMQHQVKLACISLAAQGNLDQGGGRKQADRGGHTIPSMPFQML